MMPAFCSFWIRWCTAAPDTPQMRATSRNDMRASFDISFRILLSSSSMLFAPVMFLLSFDGAKLIVLLII